MSFRSSPQSMNRIASTSRRPRYRPAWAGDALTVDGDGALFTISYNLMSVTLVRG